MVKKKRKKATGKNEKMVFKRNWEMFREVGLLWWVNRSLHLFGWALVVEVDDKGKVIGAYPARTKFRGFGAESEDRGFKRLSTYLKKNATVLHKEAQE